MLLEMFTALFLKMNNTEIKMYLQTMGQAFVSAISLFFNVIFWQCGNASACRWYFEVLSSVFISHNSLWILLFAVDFEDWYPPVTFRLCTKYSNNWSVPEKFLLSHSFGIGYILSLAYFFFVIYRWNHGSWPWCQDVLIVSHTVTRSLGTFLKSLCTVSRVKDGHVSPEGCFEGKRV